MPVFQGHLLIKVMGEDEKKEDFDAFMGNADPERILRSMSEGDLIGAVHFAGSHEVAPEEIIPRLLEIGNDGTFFEGYLEEELEDAEVSEPEISADAYPDHLEGRILRAQMRGDVSSTELQKLLLDFVRDAGLLEAFAADLDDHVTRVTSPPDLGA